MLLLLACLIAAPVLLFLRIYLILPSRTTSHVPKKKHNETSSLGVFLGSGGHTAEIHTLLSVIEFKRYTPRTYVFCPGDEMSTKTISNLEKEKGSNPQDYTFMPIPRARRVGQSPVSTLFSASWTLISAFFHFFLIPLLRNPSKPWVDVLLVNGPGTCVVLILICWIRRILGMRYTKIIYVESFARVKSLSLSGKILKNFVDTFVVQWPDAAGAEASPRTDSSRGTSDIVYKGWLV